MKIFEKQKVLLETRISCRWNIGWTFLICFTLSNFGHTATPPPEITPPSSFQPPDGPTRKHQIQIPKDADGPFQLWEEKGKNFLVITVDPKTPQETDLHFPRVDGAKIADRLVKLGYKSLLGNRRILRGEQANRNNVITALGTMKDVAPPASVLVYYSGHGITTNRDLRLWLQLAGQSHMGAGQGITLHELIKIPRNAGYNGELFIILDTSYSGQTPLPEVHSFKDLDGNTIIFSSSSTKQNSQTLRLPEGQTSAFTHTFLEALSSQWSMADQNRDGILRFSELNTFARVQLKRHFQNKALPELMTPKLSSSQFEGSFIAYQRTQVQNWGTDDRQGLQVLALERALSPSMSRGKILTKTSPRKLKISPGAKILAQHILPKTHAPFVKGLLALTDDKLDEARTFLTQSQEKEKHNPSTLAKVYLARGRTEVYAGRFRLAVVWYKKSLALQPPTDAKLLNEFGLVWVKAGLHQEALPFFEQGLKLRENSVDPHDPSLVVSLNNLAGLYHNQGKYPKAEPLYRRALEIAEHEIGPDHPSLVVQLNNLAGLYRDQGQFAKAEPLYLRVAQITERTLGPDNPKVATALNNVARTYKAQGRYAEAEALYRRVVEIDEVNLGPTHPKVAYDLNTLALLYRAQGKDEEAEPLYKRLVEIDESALGPDHPEVATDLNNLAELYRAQGKYAEAEPLYLRSYDIMRLNYGFDHVRTVTVVNNYLRMLNVSGQVEKANHFREKYEQARRLKNHN